MKLLLPFVLILLFSNISYGQCNEILPKPSVSDHESLYCQGTPEVSLEALGVEGASFIWYDENYNVLSNLSVITHSNLYFGTKWYRLVQIKGECVSDTLKFAINVGARAPIVPVYNFIYASNPSAIFAIGSPNIEWYSDSLLTNLLDTGNYYTPELQSYKLYLVDYDISLGCESQIVETTCYYLKDENDEKLLIIDLIDSAENLVGNAIEVLKTDKYYKVGSIVSLQESVAKAGVVLMNDNASVSEVESAVVNLKNAISIFHGNEITFIENSSDITLIYPNPASHNVYILSGNQVLKVEILNQFGVVVIESTNLEIDVSSLTAGVYIIKIVTERGAKSQTLIVE